MAIKLTTPNGTMVIMILGRIGGKAQSGIHCELGAKLVDLQVSQTGWSVSYRGLENNHQSNGLWVK